jgi:hypothetical protein
MHIGHFAYYRRGAGIAALLRAAPALTPYVISAVYSRSLVTPRRNGFLAFCIVLALGTMLTGLFYSGAVGVEVNFVTLLVAVTSQTACYTTAALILLQGE